MLLPLCTTCDTTQYHYVAGGNRSLLLRTSTADFGEASDRRLVVIL